MGRNLIAFLVTVLVIIPCVCTSDSLDSKDDEVALMQVMRLPKIVTGSDSSMSVKIIKVAAKQESVSTSRTSELLAIMPNQSGADLVQTNRFSLLRLENPVAGASATSEFSMTRNRDVRPDCVMLYASISAACVVFVLAVSVVASALSKETDRNPREVIGALLLHMFNLRRHVQSIFVRTDVGSSARLAPLDGIRAMAFLMVSFTHWQIEMLGIVKMDFWAVGQHGVTIFFVLSGFLVPMILVKATEKGNSSSVSKHVPAFLHQRFLRVWPSINMFVPLSLGLFYGASKLSSKLEPCSTYWTYEGYLLWAPFLCVNNYFPGRSVSPFGHLYTVSTEMQMYFCTPLMVASYYKSHHPYKGYVVALLVALGCLLAEFVLGTGSDAMGACGYLWDCLPQYIMGMLACYSYLDSIEQDSGRWRLLDPLRLWQSRAAAIVVVSIMQASMLPVIMADHEAVGIQALPVAACAAILIRSALDPDLGGLGFYFFGSWPWYPVASLSYTGYLCSFLSVDISAAIFKERVTSDNPEMLILTGYYLMSMLILMGLAFFFSVFIERPFMSIRDFSLEASTKS